MNKLLLAATAISAMLVSAPASAVTLLITQNPNPFQAVEGTAGNIGFVNTENIDTTTLTITGITAAGATPTGGELDDQATNIVLIGPMPTVTNPLILVPESNFNIKFSWDAVDNIKDNDVDFGLWDARFNLASPTGNQFVLANSVSTTPQSPPHSHSSSRASAASVCSAGAGGGAQAVA